jgi:hypothetical protein
MHEIFIKCVPELVYVEGDQDGKRFALMQDGITTGDELPSVE